MTKHSSFKLENKQARLLRCHGRLAF